MKVNFFYVFFIFLLLYYGSLYLPKSINVMDNLNSNLINSCDLLEDEELGKFCENAQGNILIEQMRQYQYLRKECIWKIIEHGDDFLYSFNLDKDYEERLGKVPFKSPTQHNKIIEFCEVIDRYSQTNDIWSIYRIGTFVGNGGYDWHDFTVSDSVDIARLRTINKKSGVYISNSLVTPIDNKEMILGYPPIHIHHTHITSNLQCESLRLRLISGIKARFDTDVYKKEIEIAKNNSGNVEFDVHGDRQCFTDNGGVNCLMRVLPRGYGIKVNNPLCILGQYNDVRSINSVPLEFKVEYAYKWSIDIGVKEIVPITNVVGGINFISEEYLVPLKGEHFVWSKKVFLQTGYFLLMYFHTHHMWTDDIWVISTIPEKLGLTNQYFPSRNSFNFVHLYNFTINDVKSHILKNLKLSRKECIKMNCEVLPSIKCMWGESNRFEKIKGKAYDRFVLPLYSKWYFKKKEEFTMISFHKSKFKFKQVKNINAKSHSILYGYAIGYDNGKYYKLNNEIVVVGSSENSPFI